MGRKKKISQPTLAGFLKKPRSESEIDASEEQDGEPSNIPLEIHEEEMQVANSQGSTPSLDLEVTSQNSLRKKDRSFRDQWKLEFPWVKQIGVEGAIRLKCTYCEKFKASGLWEVGEGSKTLQRSSLSDHDRSNVHKFSKQRWIALEAKKGKKIEHHIEIISNQIQDNIITTMKLVYWLSTNCFPLASYPPLCDLARDLQVEKMPKQDDYGTYTNEVSGREFLLALSTYVEVKKKF